MLAFLWLRPPGATSEASAQQAVENACAKLDGVDSFDMTSRVTSYESFGDGPETQFDDWTGKGEFDSGNYHVTAQELTGLRDEIAYIRVGDMDYQKLPSTGNLWKEVDGKLGDFSTFWEGLGDNPICPTTADFRDLGTAILDGEEAKRYTDAPLEGGKAYSIAEAKAAPKDGQSMRRTTEFWVNSNGELVRIDSTLWGAYVGNDGVTARWRVSHSTNFLNLGEPNVITAPVLGE